MPPLQLNFTKRNQSSVTLKLGGLDWDLFAAELDKIKPGDEGYITVHRKSKQKSMKQLGYYYGLILPVAFEAFKDDDSTKIEFWTTSIKTGATKKITLPLSMAGVDSFMKLCYAAYQDEYKDKSEMNMAECAAFENYCIRWLEEHKDCHIPIANPNRKEHTIILVNEDLAFCTTCKGGEGSLTTECCGRPMTEEEEYKVYNLGILDFIDGKWRSK